MPLATIILELFFCKTSNILIKLHKFGNDFRIEYDNHIMNDLFTQDNIKLEINYKSDDIKEQFNIMLRKLLIGEYDYINMNLDDEIDIIKNIIYPRRDTENINTNRNKYYKLYIKYKNKYLNLKKIIKIN